jgi:hypothetical protein
MRIEDNGLESWGHRRGVFHRPTGRLPIRRKAGHRSFVRIAAVSLMTMAAWLVAANHCTIATWHFGSATDVSTGSCHSTGSGNSGDDSLPTPGMQMFCGDELTSPVPPMLDAPATQFYSFKPAWVAIAAIQLEKPSVETRFFPGHSPPGGASFVEKFLSRRMLAHAPPLCGACVPAFV